MYLKADADKTSTLSLLNLKSRESNEIQSDL